MSDDEGGADAGAQARRLAQLEGFYHQHDPTKVENAGFLLRRYDVAKLAQTIHGKYGAVPAGWEGLLARA